MPDNYFCRAVVLPCEVFTHGRRLQKIYFLFYSRSANFQDKVTLL